MAAAFAPADLPVSETIRHALKPLVISMLGSNLAAALRVSLLARSETLTILNLHRVDDRYGYDYEAMNPALFDELVRWLKRRFAIVTFGGLSACKLDGKPPLILSFDDGYKDFVDIVVPILEKHRVRVNQNLIPSAFDTGLPPMNVQLRDFIRTAPAALLNETPLPGLPSGADPENREKSGVLASRVFKNRPIAEQKQIFQKLQLTFQRFDGFRPAQVMSLDEARQVDAVHEIGAHSFEHATMAQETDDYLCEDVTKCLEFFKTRLGISPSVYAFANGSSRPGQAELIHNAGFEHVLTGEGFSHRSNWMHKRFTIFAGTSAEARFRALGGFKSPWRPQRFGSSIISRERDARLVTLAIPTIGVGGAETVTMTLAKQFLTRGFRVDIVNGWDAPEPRLLVPAGARHIVLGAGRTRKALLPFARYLLRNRPDAVIASMWPFTTTCVLAQRLVGSSARVAVCEHSTLSVQYADWGPFHRLIMKESIALSYPLAHARIAVSGGVADDLADLAGIHRDSISVVYNPVTLPLNAGADGSAAEAAWGEWKGPRIITVGRLKPAKNHKLLVKAFKQLLPIRDARLMIVGSGDLAESTAAFARAEGVCEKVLMPGATIDPTPYYRSADLFVLSSDREGFGLVIVEALACGLPVVSTNCRSGPAEILANGKYGRLVPVGDEIALAKAMDEALSARHDREALKRRAAVFGPERIAEQYLNLLFPKSARPSAIAQARQIV